MKCFFIATLFAICCQLQAQEGFFIKNVKVFDGEQVIESTNVEVVENRIIKISTELKTKTNLKIIDGKGKTLIPALSNAHVHAWSPISLKQAANAGVLNVMDMHGIENYQQNMRKLNDSTNFARYFIAGYAATAPGGHGTQFGFPVPTLASPADAKTFVAERLKANVDYIKIIVEPYMEALSIETVTEIIKEAHQSNLKAVVHVSKLEDGIEVLKNNADALVHIWWDKVIDEEELNYLATQKEFFIIPTLLTTLKAFEQIENEDYLSKSELLAEVKKLHDAKVPILAGTDPPNVGINYGTDLYEELFLFKEAGLSNIEILKTATSNPAEAFGLKKMGYLKQGYVADMLLIDGDPTENIEEIKNIEMIWKAGKLLDIKN
jgi:imidazolonepropionase-like amidohydrolase